MQTSGASFVSAILCFLCLGSLSSSVCGENGPETQGSCSLVDNFNDGNANGWFASQTATWSVENGQYSALTNRSMAHQATSTPRYFVSNGTIDLNAIPQTGSMTREIGLEFRYKDARNHYFFCNFCQGFGGYPSPARTVLLKKVNGRETWLGVRYEDGVPGKSYHIKVILSGSRIICYRNGVVIFDVIDTSLPSGYFNIHTFLSHVHFDNVVARQESCVLVIKQISPVAAKAGDVVRITGYGFGKTPTGKNVLFGKLRGEVLSWSNTVIQARVPKGARTAPLSIQVGSSKTNAVEFVVLPTAPNTLWPLSGPPYGGTRVAFAVPGFTGGMFNVLFGSKLAANVSFTEPNIIVCSSPAGTGSVTVGVTTSATFIPVGSFAYD